MNTSKKRMQLLWALTWIILIIVPLWILIQQTNSKPNQTNPNANKLQQQIKNRTNITNFREAKRAMYQLYSDHRLTFYCGCDFTATRTINLLKCGMPALGKRIKTEAEHVVPASHFGKKMACWQRGGRKECSKRDIAFQKAEGDLINLVPTVGYINMRRSNYHFGEISGEKREFGTCDFEVHRRIAEPAPNLLGFIARITLYMDLIYDISLTDAEKERLKQQSITYPPTAWEILRDKRIEKIQGNGNPFLKN